MGRLTRRQYLCLVGAGFAAWPLAVAARRKPAAARVRKIGFLTLDNADTEFFLKGLMAALRDLGFGEAALQNVEDADAEVFRGRHIFGKLRKHIQILEIVALEHMLAHETV